jgi:hypothetical protein
MNKLALPTLLAMVAVFILPTTVAVAVEADSSAHYQQLALLTSCGQAADILIVKGLCARVGLNIVYRPQATADSLIGSSVKPSNSTEQSADTRTLLLVAGGSSKGLGAAKANPDKEIQRVKALVAKAKSAKIPIITLHIGGEARRGALSDPFNKLAAEAAQVLIVVKGGDDDGFFKKIAADKKIRYIELPNQAEIGNALKELMSNKQ